ncbi:MAG: hypothetical protein WB579_02280, partial [Bryobacteraceae bacterium]
MTSIFPMASAVLFVSSAFGQASSSLPSYRFLSGGSALNIPVEVIANGLVFVRATVNGHLGWFILD